MRLGALAATALLPPLLGMGVSAEWIDSHVADLYEFKQAGAASVPAQCLLSACSVPARCLLCCLLSACSVPAPLSAQCLPIVVWQPSAALTATWPPSASWVPRLAACLVALLTGAAALLSLPPTATWYTAAGGRTMYSYLLHVGVIAPLSRRAPLSSRDLPRSPLSALLSRRPPIFPALHQSPPISTDLP